MNTSFLQEILTSVAERGRQLLPRSLVGEGRRRDIVELSKALVSSRGEASGVALAADVLTVLEEASPAKRAEFLRFLAEELNPNMDAITAAAARFIADSSPESLRRLQDALESPRQELFRRLNFAPGGTQRLVAFRRELMAIDPKSPHRAPVERDLLHLFTSWFNRGFLVLRRIDWNTPAVILEKIIAYEAVHEIQSWEDLRRRLDPADRRCFAFFHPSLVDEPLIFVEVALMRETPARIEAVLNEHPKSRVPQSAGPTTAVFYSISNCQEGLRGISFGNFLIKQVVEELAREVPSLTTFVTLSPVPGFARWLTRQIADEKSRFLTPVDRVALQVLGDPAWPEAGEAEELSRLLMRLAAQYFLEVKAADGKPTDPVARFHLGNGARLERINWLGDRSPKGLGEAHGLMVNYRYELAEIERNHEAYANEGTVAATRAVRGLLKG